MSLTSAGSSCRRKETQPQLCAVKISDHRNSTTRLIFLQAASCRLARGRQGFAPLRSTSWIVSTPRPALQRCLAPLALQPRAPGAGGQRPGRRATPGCACHPHGQARLAVPAGQDRRPHHSATRSPDPPSSAGKSFSFGRPSRIGRTVSA